MASKFTGSLKLPKMPKAPKANASPQSWDAYEKKISERNKRKSAINSEKARRAKIREKARQGM